MTEHAGSTTGSYERALHIALSCLLAAVLLSTPTVDAATTRSQRRILHVPTNRYPTIQSAIDAAPGGATIRIKPGVFAESIVIDGKRLRVAGTTTSDGQRTVLVGSPNGGPIVDYGLGGGVHWQASRFEVGRAGRISGGPDDQSRPARLLVRESM